MGGPYFWKYAEIWLVMDGGCQMANGLWSGGLAREEREKERYFTHAGTFSPFLEPATQ
jgi:hypothetical protein